jgi:hypothetical protein
MLTYYYAHLEDEYHAPVIFYGLQCYDDQTSMNLIATIETVQYSSYEIWRGQDELIATGPRLGHRPFERRRQSAVVQRLPANEALILALRQSVDAVRDILKARTSAH